MDTRGYEHYHRPERRFDGVVPSTLAHALPLLFAAGQRPEKGADWLAEFSWDVVDPLELIRGWLRIRRMGTCRGIHNETPWFTLAERISRIIIISSSSRIIFKGVLVEVEDDVEGDGRFIVEIAHNFALVVRALIVDEFAQRFQARRDVLPTAQMHSRRSDICTHDQ